MMRELWEELGWGTLSRGEGRNSNEANRRKPRSDKEQGGICSKRR